MRTTKYPKARINARSTLLQAQSNQVCGSGAKRYVAYAVAADGSRVPLDAVGIVVDLGGAELEIDLVIAHPLLVRKLRMAVRADGLLVVGPADAGSIQVAIEPFHGQRLRPS